MPTLEIVLPKPHPGQEIIKRERRRFNVVDCGRRFGKSQLGIDLLVEPTVLTYPVGWFSPTSKMLLEIWRTVERILEPITVRKSTRDYRLDFVTGGVLEFWSLDNPNAARGRKYKRLIGDEWALVANSLDVWNFVLRPTLLDLMGDAYFLSTPKGRNGFWQMWQWGQDPLYKEWASWKMPTSANPFIPQSEIDAMRATMPDIVYRQEILGEFIDDSNGVFRGVLAAATASEQAEAVKGHEYLIGVDWAKSADFTCFAVLDLTEKALVKLERFNQIDYTVQMGRLSALCQKFHPLSVIVERNSIGEPLIESLQRAGLPIRPFTTTNATKTAIIDALTLAFEKGELRIIPDPVLLGELQAYEMERLPSGLFRYSAPEGLHDDTVMSLAFAWSGASKPKRREAGSYQG